MAAEWMLVSPTWMLVSPTGDIWEGDDPWLLASQAAPVKLPELPLDGDPIHREWQEKEARKGKP